MGNTPSSPKKDHQPRQCAVALVSKRFLSEMEDDEKYHLFLGGCGMLVNAVTNMLFPRVVGNIIDSGTSGNTITNGIFAPYHGPSSTNFLNGSISSGSVLNSDSRIFTNLLLYALPLYIAGTLASYTRVTNTHYCVYLIQKRLRRNIFKKLLKQGAPFFHLNSTSYLLTLTFNDCDEAPRMMIESSMQFLRSCNSTLGGTFNLCCLSPILAALSLLCIPLFGFCAMEYSRLIKRFKNQWKLLTDSSAAKAEEVINGIENVMAYGKEDDEVLSFETYLNACDAVAHKVCSSEGVFMGSILAGINLCTLVLLYFGSRQLRTGRISVGNLASFVMYGGLIGLGASGFSKAMTEMSKASISLERIYQIMDLPQLETKGEILESIEGTIEFQDVSFAYATRADVSIFQGLNLKIEAGDLVAVVGTSGVGKSTLVGLLTTLYKPTSGVYKLDGHLVSSLDSQWLRRNAFATVAQEPILFSMSILENIKYGNPWATFQEVVDIAKRCNIHDFIASLPQGYDTLVGPKGILLSVGERQRVALAAALLKDAKILILDEATSALDGHSEEVIAAELREYAKGATVILITHRPCTLKIAQKVIVLADSGIEYYGPLEAAASASPTFTNIFNV